ncbi:MAG TPA: hypothetical protein VHA78_04310 [Candidatus Peribacteraceae bacterium]|nr:hypothetical protein [Candidatus Peribacteraceae bacterium]
MESSESYIHNNPIVRRSPISYLSPEQFEQAKGKLIALLLAGKDKGTLIAQAPLNPDNPSVALAAIREQVASSIYKGRHYQLQQISTEAMAQ